MGCNPTVNGERREADATLAHRMGEGLGVRASGEAPISIHPRATAIRSHALAADIRATRIGLRATAADSRAIGIYIRATAIDRREIASYIREIAADNQEMPVNIEETSIDSRRIAARSRGIGCNLSISNDFRCKPLFSAW